MIIANYYEKVKQWIRENKTDLFVAAVIFFVGLASFGLGRLSVLWPEKEPITIENYESALQPGSGQGIKSYGTTVTPEGNANSESVIPNSRGRYVASKSGTRYHFPWCSGAQRIKEENKIWFQTKEEAEKAGYKPALNCPDL